MIIRLSNRQAKEADRVGGIELILPYPADHRPPKLALDEDCDASPAERAAAEQMLGDLGADGLVPVHVRVARLRRQDAAPDDPEPVRHYLAVTIIGRRWVHASTRRAGKVMWSHAALEEGAGAAAPADPLAPYRDLASWRAALGWSRTEAVDRTGLSLTTFEKGEKPDAKVTDRTAIRCKMATDQHRREMERRFGRLETEEDVRSWMVAFNAGDMISKLKPPPKRD